jgi:hypothetical protein
VCDIYQSNSWLVSGIEGRNSEMSITYLSMYEFISVKVVGRRGKPSETSLQKIRKNPRISTNLQKNPSKYLKKMKNFLKIPLTHLRF